MIEACFIIMIVFACIMVVILIIRWCFRLYDLHSQDLEALRDLETFMHKNDVPGVRALLEIRGHLLKKNIRDNAKIWLAEKS